MQFSLEQLNDILYCTRATLKHTRANSEFTARINDLHEAVYAEIEKIVMEQPSPSCLEDEDINIVGDFPDFEDMEFEYFLEAVEAAEAYYATDLNIETNTANSFSYTDVNGDRVHVGWDGRSSRKFAYVQTGKNNAVRMSLKRFVHLLAGLDQPICKEVPKAVKSTEIPIPRYVKCIAPYGYARVGEVYDTTDDLEAHRMFSLSWKDVLITFGHLYGNGVNANDAKRFEAVKNGGRVK